MFALGGLKGARAAPRLIDALSDPDSIVRVFAVSELGRIGDSRAVEAVRPLLDDEDSLVRESAADVLEMLGAGGGR
jgi:HEAT repeat protein